MKKRCDVFYASAIVRRCRRRYVLCRPSVSPSVRYVVSAKSTARIDGFSHSVNSTSWVKDELIMFWGQKVICVFLFLDFFRLLSVLERKIHRLKVQSAKCICICMLSICLLK